MSSSFTGFTRATVSFFETLRDNNRKEWFEGNRRVFDGEVSPQARSFVVSMGERLREIAPAASAIPAIDKSIFRIHRDTRFSPDKSPYKPHLGILFWEGSRPKLECSGFYFHLEPPKLSLGVGLYLFPASLSPLYREWVTDETRGKELSGILAALEGAGKGFTIGGLHYKRVPRGYDPSCANAELLKHNGLYAMYEIPIPTQLYSAELLDFCMEIFRPMKPLHHWLLELTEASI